MTAPLSPPQVFHLAFVEPGAVRPGDEVLHGEARRALLKLYRKWSRDVAAPVDLLVQEQLREKLRRARRLAGNVERDRLQYGMDDEQVMRLAELVSQISAVRVTRRMVREGKRHLGVELAKHGPTWKRTVAVKRPVA